MTAIRPQYDKLSVKDIELSADCQFAFIIEDLHILKLTSC